MKTALQAANDLLHVMTEVGQADCYLNDMRLVITELTHLGNKNAQILAALKEFGQHKPDCHKPFTGGCDCGFSEATK